jgi:hypothetical protein
MSQRRVVRSSAATSSMVRRAGDILGRLLLSRRHLRPNAFDDYRVHRHPVLFSLLLKPYPHLARHPEQDLPRIFLSRLSRHHRLLKRFDKTWLAKLKSDLVDTFEIADTQGRKPSRSRDIRYRLPVERR